MQLYVVIRISRKTFKVLLRFLSMPSIVSLLRRIKVRSLIYQPASDFVCSFVAHASTKWVASTKKRLAGAMEKRTIYVYALRLAAGAMFSPEMSLFAI